MAKTTRAAAARPMIALAVAILTAICASAGHAADPVGQTARVQGTATATDSEATRNLAVPDPIHQQDQLATADSSRLEVNLRDGTQLTLGENATVKVSQFVYQETNASNALQVLAVGAFKMVTGAINKSRDSNVQVITPIGALSVRGTDLWGGPIDGVYGVFLIEGEVTVTTNAGSVTLTEPGSGTNIADIDSPPGEIRQWPQEKVDRAIATVTFAQ